MLVIIIYYSFMMLVVLMLITFTIHTNGQWESRSLSLTTAIMDYLNQNRTIDSSGDIMKSILDDPVLFPSIISKLSQENRTTVALQYLFHHASLELFKSVVVLNDYPHNDEHAIHDAWKFLKLLNGAVHNLMDIDAYNKNNSKKLHVTMHRSKKFMIRLNYSNQEMSSQIKDFMEWSHIPSFLDSLTIVYYTAFANTISGINGRPIHGYINVDLTSFDQSCNLSTLTISFTSGWVHFPDYSFPSSLKNLAIRGDIMWFTKKANYKRLWRIGRSIERLQLKGMWMDLCDFDGFENMIHLKDLYVEGFPSHKIDRLEEKLNKLFQNTLRVEPTFVFSYGAINIRLMTFDMISDNDECATVCFGTICLVCSAGALSIIPLYLLLRLVRYI
eukprot:119443_1